ncbi:MAG TPA: hypothetical protein VGQ04_12330 [Chitinophagaceae bacterium]|jgi:hypothetical protein|nr:hypothetical protein [Chitinophagaceae bacterium]
MKKINYQPTILFALLLALSGVLFSFSVKTISSYKNNFGGEGFEVYLNDKLVLQQYGKDIDQVKSLQLDQGISNGQLAIRYYHCGRPGKGRVVTIRDEQNVVLKEWKFGDAKDASAKVCCNVKDILALPKLKAGQKVNLYYSSNELPKGRLLAILTTANKNAVQP